MIAGPPTVNYAPYELVVAKDIKKSKTSRVTNSAIAASAGLQTSWLAGIGKARPTPAKTCHPTNGRQPRTAGRVSQGAIQATLLEQSFAYRAKKEGLHTLIDYSTIGSTTSTGIGTTESFIEKQRE